MKEPLSWVLDPGVLQSCSQGLRGALRRWGIVTTKPLCPTVSLRIGSNRGYHLARLGLCGFLSAQEHGQLGSTYLFGKYMCHLFKMQREGDRALHPLAYSPNTHTQPGQSREPQLNPGLQCELAGPHVPDPSPAAAEEHFNRKLESGA